MAGGRTIGEISRQTGVAATTLRYYEQIGLVPEPTRRAASVATTTRFCPGSR